MHRKNTMCKNLKKGVSQMKQVLNGFKQYYYLTDTAEIYNANSHRILTADNNRYRLLTQDNQYKSVSRKELYKLVYDKILCEDTIENLQGEEWKEIKGSDGLYHVSNKGRIKSL